MTSYRCPVCGYLHMGNIDFHFCPNCNSPADAFLHDLGADNFGRWDANTRNMIRAMAATGSPYMEGKGTTREFRDMNDLVFLPAQIDTLPLGDATEVDSTVTLGKTAKVPITLKTPILNAAMSYGALSKEAKMDSGPRVISCRDNRQYRRRWYAGRRKRAC